MLHSLNFGRFRSGWRRDDTLPLRMFVRNMNRITALTYRVLSPESYNKFSIISCFRLRHRTNTNYAKEAIARILLVKSFSPQTVQSMALSRLHPQMQQIRWMLTRPRYLVVSHLAYSWFYACKFGRNVCLRSETFVMFTRAMHAIARCARVMSSYVVRVSVRLVWRWDTALVYVLLPGNLWTNN